MKRCPRCDRTKSLDEFYGDRTKGSGHRWICKACDLERSRAYYRQHREGVLRRMSAKKRAS
jgi:hypothetical protein